LQKLEEDGEHPAGKTSKTHGIAIQFTQDESKAWRVQVVKENGPAWSVCCYIFSSILNSHVAVYIRGKGILPGDIIADVDGVDVLRLPFKEVTDLIRGPSNSIVSIGLIRYAFLCR
jgi:hypothetical protein